MSTPTFGSDRFLYYCPQILAQTLHHEASKYRNKTWYAIENRGISFDTSQTMAMGGHRAPSGGFCGAISMVGSSTGSSGDQPVTRLGMARARGFWPDQVPHALVRKTKIMIPLNLSFDLLAPFIPFLTVVCTLSSLHLVYSCVTIEFCI